MVKLACSRGAPLADAVTHVTKCARCSAGSGELAATLAAGTAGEDEVRVPHRALAQLASRLRACPDWKGPTWVHELVHGALPVPEELHISDEPPKTPEELRKDELLKARAKTQLLHKQYNKMVQNVKHSSTGPDQERSSFQDGMMGTSVAFNLVLAMGTCACLGFFLGFRMFGRTGGYVMGLIGLIGGMLVEVALMMIYASKEEMTPEQRRRFRRMYG
eukprot:TRINITY_DN17701_c0_g1_i1.p1 TRINITY_DN17701_c0_g1~~TRINITY_DN17701_c0_g1_i1.p1  ORF type:complete len:225 (-),score=68.22 TRINITY_DN17701_c0_g1_i1:19-672(-)